MNEKKKKREHKKNTWGPNNDRRRLGPFYLRCGQFKSLAGKVEVVGALGVGVNQVVVVVEGGEREDSDGSMVVEEGIVDDVYRGCMMNTWISLFGKRRGGT